MYGNLLKRLTLVAALLLWPVCANSAELKLIVIDPGHGGTDAGVRGLSGAQEKDLTLAVAKKLSKLIQERLGVRVVLTREEDETLSLYQRTAVANNLKADLFISLHFNADFSPRQASLEIYTLAHQDYPAAKSDSPPAGAVVWEEAQNEFFIQSQHVAQALYERALKSPATPSCQLRQAPLLVLQGVHSPAVLIEMNYLSTTAQEERIVTDGYKEELARTLYQGIADYRDNLVE